jgi:hypothetical protein
MNTPEVTDLLWAQFVAQLGFGRLVFITREQFDRALDAWEIEPVEINGELAFATLTKGPEFHFASFETGRPISLAMIRERIEPLMERHGFVTTRTPKSEPRQHRFNRLFGFKATGEDEFFVHYRLERACP